MMSDITPIFDALPDEYRGRLELARQNISEAFRTVTMWRTPALLRMSVLNDVAHPTPDSKYWQLVNEMYTHSTGLANLLFDIEEKQLELEEVEHQIGVETDRFAIRKLDVKRRRIEFELMNMQKVARARVEELSTQNAAMEEIKPLMKYGTESPEGHQLESFALSWTSEVCEINEHTDVDSRRNIISRWLTCMNVLETIGQRDKFIKSLPESQRKKLVELGLITHG